MNKAFNAIRGIAGHVKQLASDVSYSATNLNTYAFRNAEARKAFDAKHGPKYDYGTHQTTPRKAVPNNYQWAPGSMSWGRIGATAGIGYAGLDAGYRALSGGSLYRNSDGERDLVGIPLV
jgi:hypothetical protein